MKLKLRNVHTVALTKEFVKPNLVNMQVFKCLFLAGVEAIVVDYIRPSLFGGKTLIPNIAQGAVWLLSGVTLGGLYYFNYTDVGIVTAIKMLWTGL